MLFGLFTRSDPPPASPFQGLAAARKARIESVTALNQVLADTMTLRDLYKKHHRQASGPRFYELHVLFDKHCGEQEELADAIAERIQALGGVAIAMAADVAQQTTIPRPPRGSEETSRQLARLADAHEQLLLAARSASRRAAGLGDDATNDLLAADVIPVNEKQAWLMRHQPPRLHASPEQ